MSQASRQEVTAKWQSRYLKASRRLRERHGELVMDGETRNQLLTISALTIDRLLQRCRSESGRGKSMTKPGS